MPSRSRDGGSRGGKDPRKVRQSETKDSHKRKPTEEAHADLKDQRSGSGEAGGGGKEEEESSRLIVRGLPPYITEARLQEHVLGCVGTAGVVLTDLKVMKTAQGKARSFGFVGFSSAADAAAARKKVDRTYIDTFRLSCGAAKPYGDSSLPRP